MKRLSLAFVVACNGSVVTADAAPDALPDSAMPDAGQPPCGTPRCTADPKPNDMTVATCQSLEASQCAGKFDAWASCVDNGTSCDPMTNQTDPTSKLQAYNDCKPLYDALQTCCSTNAVSGCASVSR